MSSRIWLPTCGLAAAVLTFAGCFSASSTTTTSTGDPRQDFIYAVFAPSKALTVTGDRRGAALKPWLEGGRLDPVEADQAQVANVQALIDVREETAKVKVPDDRACQELMRIILQYFDWQEHAGERYDEWIEIAKNENPGSYETRVLVNDAIGAIDEQEQVWQAKINSIAREIGVPVGGA